MFLARRTPPPTQPSNSTRRNALLPAVLLASLCFLVGPIRAQSPTSNSAPRLSWRHDPNVNEEYKKWLREDVVYIISDQDRADFKKLASDQQRDDFVVAFWESKNPKPGSARNAYKEEHYRRLAYANQHFAAEIPGWRTDRGRF
jgi:GWxTD domain-containing protein